MKIEVISAAIAAKRFQFLNFNRPVSPQAVGRLTESVKKNGVIRPITIVRTSAVSGKRGHYIADGQHLFTALLRMEKDIPYITLDCNDMDCLYSLIVELNTTAKSWGLGDYIRLWAAGGNKDFLELQKLNIDTRLYYSQLIVLLTGKSKKLDKVRRGDFKIFRTKFAHEIINEIDELRADYFLNSDMMLAYYRFRWTYRKEFNFSNMLAKFSHNSDLFHDSNSTSNREFWEDKFIEIWENK